MVYDIEAPDKENAGKLTLQLLYASEDTYIPADEMRLVRRLAGLGPMIEKMITDSGYHTQDMVISLPSGVTVLMDDCSDQKFDENGNVVCFDPRERPWWKPPWMR